MKRWQNAAVGLGFAAVVAFVIERPWRAGARWSDVRELLPGLAGFGVFLCMMAAVPLTVFVFGYVLWRGIWQKAVKKMPEVQASPLNWRHVIVIAVLSVIMALAAAGVTKMWTPGWMITGTLGIWSGPHHVNFSIGGAIFFAVGVDSTICFVVLWNGYLLWRRFRRV
jgi:hypothetical protein